MCLQLNCGQTCQRCRLGENVTLQMRDWQEAIDFFADIPAAEIDMHHFAQEPVPWLQTGSLGMDLDTWGEFCLRLWVDWFLEVYWVYSEAWHLNWLPSDCMPAMEQIFLLSTHLRWIWGAKRVLPADRWGRIVEIGLCLLSRAGGKCH